MWMTIIIVKNVFNVEKKIIHCAWLLIDEMNFVKWIFVTRIEQFRLMSVTHLCVINICVIILQQVNN